MQAEPTEFAGEYCSGRVWINGVSTSRVYFGDFSIGYNLFANMDNVALEICSAKVNGSSSMRNSSRDSYADILNMLWFKGAEGLFANGSGKPPVSCLKH